MTKIKIVPRGHWVLVRPVVGEARENEYGIIMPSNVEQEQKAQGEVEAVGELVKDIKKGDKIIYGAYAGEILKTREEGKEVERKLILEEDVVAFIK